MGGYAMKQHTAISRKPQETAYPTSYYEEQIGKVLYRVTNIYKGEISLKDALEDLAVRRAVREALADVSGL